MGVLIFAIEPHFGAGPVKFGMRRDAVRAALQAEFKTFRRTPISEECDHFVSLGVFAYYATDGELEALEFATPSAPILEQSQLLAMTMGEAARRLGGELDEEGCTSLRLGVGVWAPHGGRRARVETVIVFRPGYYD